MHGRSQKPARSLHFGGIRRNACTQARRLITRRVAGSNPAPATAKGPRNGVFPMTALSERRGLPSFPAEGLPGGPSTTTNAITNTSGTELVDDFACKETRDVRQAL